MTTFLNFNMSLKLHRIGIKAVSGFYYPKAGRDKIIYSTKDIFTGMSDFESVYVPAYLSCDLDNAMPQTIAIKNMEYDLVIRKSKNKYDVRYENLRLESIYREYSPSPVEARARMILFLNNKKLLNNE